MLAGESKLDYEKAVREAVNRRFSVNDLSCCLQNVVRKILFVFEIIVTFEIIVSIWDIL